MKRQNSQTFPDFPCHVDEKRVGDLICMPRSHLLYINKGKNIAILKDNRNLPLRLGYPRSSISQHTLYIIDASEGGKATRVKIIAWTRGD